MSRPSTGWIAATAITCLLFMTVLLGPIILGGAENSEGTAAGICQQYGGSGPAVNGEPPLVSYYLKAAARYRLGKHGYAYLGAINSIETGFGTNLAVSSAGAVGWMQFEPSTWAQFAVSVTDPNAKADPDDPQDAIYTAARYLHASGAPGDWDQAIWAYNHSQQYIDDVESTAQGFMGVGGPQRLQDAINTAWETSAGSGGPAQTTAIPVDQTAAAAGLTAAQQQQLTSECGPLAGSEDVADDVGVTPVPGKTAVIMPSGLARPGKDAPTRVQAMVGAGDRIVHFDYQWGGGHADPQLSDSQTHPQPEGGTEPGQNGTPGYDCSGSTDYVLWGGGFGQSLLDGSDPASGELGDLGTAGQGKWVTWWVGNGHVFIAVDGIVLDTVPGPWHIVPASPSTGPRWQPLGQIQWEQTNDLQVAPFYPRHIPGL